MVVLRGINRSGLEYAGIQGWGFFASPHPNRIDDPSMLAAMKRWNINVVRVPVNEDCWLGLHTAPGRGGRPYRRIVEAYVRAQRRVPVRDPRSARRRARRGQVDGAAADGPRDHAPEFWRSWRAFKRTHALVFDLFNEPFGIGWNCWLRGCRGPASRNFPAYRAAGMQTLVDAVRAAGAVQPLLLGGLDYSSQLAGWAAHAPVIRATS